VSQRDDEGSKGPTPPGHPGRSARRHAARRPIEIKCQHWDQFLRLCTENVSTNGLLVRIAQPLPLGTPIEIRLSTPDGSVVQLDGEVARLAEPSREGGLPGMAIKIVESDLEALEQIAGLYKSFGAAEASVPDTPAVSSVPGVAPPESSVPSSVPPEPRGLARSRSGTLMGQPGPGAPRAGEHRPATVRRPAAAPSAPPMDRRPPSPPAERTEDPSVPPPPPWLAHDSGFFGLMGASAPGSGPARSVSVRDVPSVPPPAEERGVHRTSRTADGRYSATPDAADRVDTNPPAEASLQRPASSPSMSLVAHLAGDGGEGQNVDGVDDEDTGRWRMPPRQPRGTPIQYKEHLRTSTPEPPRVPALPGNTTPIVGLDFGTTYSKIGVVLNGDVVLIEEDGCQAANPAAVPSIVAYPDGASTPLVGHRAREYQNVDPSRVIMSVKRVLGRRYHDPAVSGVLGSMACRSMAGPDDSILFEAGGRRLTAVEVTSHIIRHMKTLADTFAGTSIQKAVMTAPVDFDDRARRELKLAARMAGLEAVAIIPEPTAAVIGCGHDGSSPATVAVYDFGGGTFDAAVIEVGQNRFDVRGASGDRWLGGADIDAAIARYVADEFFRSTGINLFNQAEQWIRLLTACEEGKRWLSTLPVADVILPEAGRRGDASVTLFVPVTRACLEELASELIQSSLEVCSVALAQGKLPAERIQEVLVTGGTTRVPAVRDAVRRYFAREPRSGVHPEHAVVMGAAIYAAMSSGEKFSAEALERLRGKGVVSQTIGIALADGSTEHIIERSKRPPVAAFRLYGTSKDNQRACGIKLYEGDAPVTAENRFIGGFVIDGLPEGSAGTVDIEVYFELSSTGTLCVTAQERSTGRRQRKTFEVNLV